MSEIKEMKQYTCIKNVKAIPMTDGEFFNTTGKMPYNTDKDINGSLEGYLVKYEDGYESWSPKEVFEKGYVLTETYLDRMKFELAELNKRIVKGTQALYTLNQMNYFERNSLCEQLGHMRCYADALYNRIVYSVPEGAMNKDEALKTISKGSTL